MDLKRQGTYSLDVIDFLQPGKEQIRVNLGMHLACKIYYFRIYLSLKETISKKTSKYDKRPCYFNRSWFRSDTHEIIDSTDTLLSTASENLFMKNPQKSIQRLCERVCSTTKIFTFLFTKWKYMKDIYITVGQYCPHNVLSYVGHGL